jgi:UPF0755 protein
MTGKALSNLLFAAGGVVVASAVWAGAMLLPSPPVRLEASRSAPEAEAPTSAPAHDAQSSAAIAPAAPAAGPSGKAEAASQPAAAAVPSPAPLMATMDRNAFGMLLPLTITSAPVQRMTMLDSLAPISLAPSALPPGALESIGATFAEPALQALPQLGGAAALDGPADAGLEERVNQAELQDPKVPSPTGRIIALDASEGTKIDPLRQRNWDLNAVQNVPALQPPPPAPAQTPRR